MLAHCRLSRSPSRDVTTLTPATILVVQSTLSPARLSSEVLARVKETALTVHRTLGLGHVSRTDLIVDQEGTPWFIDVNIVPGMTETLLFPLAVKADGDLPGVYNSLVHAPLS